MSLPDDFYRRAPQSPGVYRMYGVKKNILYVGKARNLRKRLASYFRAELDSAKTASLMTQVADISWTVTASENEALILESALIKQFKPRYNVLLKDDKSYPYLLFTGHDFPKLAFHRGAKKEKGEYWGPYPSSTALRESIQFIQKVFMLRTCEDSYFKNRTRPCLQYQIKRCTAPCVDYVTQSAYAQQVKDAKNFLQGKADHLIKALVTRMNAAAKAKLFEEAASFRDQIRHLRHIQSDRMQTANSDKACDVIAIVMVKGTCCIQKLMVRFGRLLGSKSYFPNLPQGTEVAEIAEAFLTQMYLSEKSEVEIPDTFVLNTALVEQDLLATALREKQGKRIALVHQPRGARKAWLDMAICNGEEALRGHFSNTASVEGRLLALQHWLGLGNLPERIECFDVSHTGGEATVASCVVYGASGADKQAYRRFNIKDVTPGDDYGAMKQALLRRYQRLQKEGQALPDLILIDGGKGQLHVAEEALAECQVQGVPLLAIAKGPARKAGFETLFLSGQGEGLQLAEDDVVLHLLQEIRDEAHRFAIGGHRGQRARARKLSILEELPGVGQKRRNALLQHFGGLQGLKKASAQEIAKVPGISHKLAEEIYAFLCKHA